jgi:hypothetical protein
MVAHNIDHRGCLQLLRFRIRASLAVASGDYCRDVSQRTNNTHSVAVSVWSIGADLRCSFNGGSSELPNAKRGVHQEESS